MNHNSDIDIDFANRADILEHIEYIFARKKHKKTPERHNTGIYVQPIPYDPKLGCASIHYKDAEERGYFKLDFLNVYVYQFIKDEEHYQALLEREPPWYRLAERDFVKQIIHISNYPDEIAKCMPDTIPRLAMFIAALRPGKRHLLGKSWKEISAEIWEKVDNDAYAFKKSHSVAYAVLVALHMNLIDTIGPLELPF